MRTAAPGNREREELYYNSTSLTCRFGERLRELRKQRSLSQMAMAMQFGIDRGYISDLERGRKSANLPMIEVIALGFDISLSELFKGL